VVAVKENWKKKNFYFILFFFFAHLTHQCILSCLFLDVISKLVNIYEINIIFI